MFNSDVGEIHRVEIFSITLVLPSIEPESCFIVVCFLIIYSDVGEIHRSRFSVILVLPFMILATMQFEHFTMGQVAYDMIHRGRLWAGIPYPILYIYSLGHFLTTKGALIDGDGYPPKNPKNDPKNSQKMINFHSNLETKMCQKHQFLMAKSSFSLKFTTIDQKSLKIEVKKWSKTVILNGKIEFFIKIDQIDTKND